jgi:mono/diheme cytochrome c family protein
MPQGIALSPDDKLAYVDERNTGDVAVIAIDRVDDGISLSVSGAPIARLEKDPMPAALREGQHLFFSANSDELPITKNHWVACSSCHIEGRSDAVTWRFGEGPRDTPSNAGGVEDTGFLLRTADRRSVQDYWETINVEQGGAFKPDNARLGADLDAIALFVNRAIPAPIPPRTDAALVAKGKAIFERVDVGCSGCHSGPAYTDSGLGNGKLDLAGPVLLHDVGTCVTEGFVDRDHADADGHARTACAFDTPTLRGISDSAPYLHDGSAATLEEVLLKTRGRMGDITSLSQSDLDALVEYLRSL